MKALFIGGVKSGKSTLAENHILDVVSGKSGDKPYYLATTEFIDDEMKARIAIHQQRRQNQFVTLEEPIRLLSVLQQCQRPVLVECVSMWLNNMLHHQIAEVDILFELESIMQLRKDLVLVHNEVGLGIIPNNALARQFVDSGKAAQIMARYCDHVYWCSAGLKLAMK